MNMSNFSKFLLAAIAVMGLAACSDGAKIKGVVETAPSSEVVVKLLDVNTFTVLDTVATNARGEFSYKVDVAKAQPEFVYLFYKDTKIASLLLQRGDKVSVKADTLGNYTVDGSEESLKLAEVEKKTAEITAKMNEVAGRLVSATNSQEEVQRLSKELSRMYIEYYRQSVKYVVENSHSLTVVPVLFQMLDENVPVFSQMTDGYHFATAADSLATLYPDSRYVKALRAEADKRMNRMGLASRLRDAQAVNFPEIELPDIKGNKVKLSEVDAKVILLHFWDSSNAEQKMLNQDVLAPVYKEFHNRGFEIFQVALNPDKTDWAQVVKKQGRQWISVCDVRGAASPLVTLYGISALPTSYIIGNGTLISASVSDAASLRKLLDSML